MRTTEELLQLIADQQLVLPAVHERLRQLYEVSPREFTPRVMRKWLVSRGHLTDDQFEKLLAAPQQTVVPRSHEDYELSLAPLEDDTRDDLELAPLDEDDDDSTPTAVAPAPMAPTGSPSDQPPTGQPPPMPAGAVPPPLPGTTTAVRQHALDALFADELDDATATTGNVPPAAGTVFQQYRVPGRGGTWDSPLMVLGGGGLLLLLVLGGVLYWSLGRQSAEQAFAAAESDYQAGAYTQAVFKFDRYLAQHPRHENASLARVHRGLAQLRLVTEGTQDWARAFETAQEVLDQIAPEASFRSAQAELGVLLPAIAEGLARASAEQPTAAGVDRAEQALRLARNPRIVPVDLQPRSTLDNAGAAIAVATRALERNRLLEETLGGIEQALADEQPAAAHRLRQQALRQHPELADEPRLQAAFQAVSSAERQLVRWVDDPSEPRRDAPAAPIEAWRLPLTMSKTRAAEGASGGMVCALDRGVLYGLDAANGNMVWRRFVGADSEQPPLRVGADDVVIVDAALGELLRLDVANGRPRWRLSLPDRATAPLLVRDQIYLGLRDGRLLVVDVATGKSSGYIQLPQPLRLAAAADARHAVVYQLADHANLFTLSAADGRCLGVTYLGHTSGEIAAPPVAVGSWLLVAHNRSATSSRLHVWSVDEQGVPHERHNGPTLKGQLRWPPTVVGRRVFAVTDSGAIYVWEVADANAEQPLTLVAQRTAVEGRPSMPHYALVHQDKLWVAGVGLTRYAIQVSSGRLAPERVEAGDDWFLQSPELIGDTLWALRRPRLGGLVAEAWNVSGEGSLWQTRWGRPLAAFEFEENRTPALWAVDHGGAVYTQHAAEASDLTNGPFAWPAGVTARGETTLTDNAPTPRLDDGRLVFAAELPQRADSPAATSGQTRPAILLVDPRSAPPKASWLPTTLRLSAPAEPVGNWLVTPIVLGQLLLLDPNTGREVGPPFQPPLTTGAEVAWSRLAVFDDGLVITDGESRLFHLTLDQTTSPRLRRQSEAALRHRPVSDPAVIGATVYLVDDQQRLLAFGLPGLAPGEQWALNADCVWGPRRVGDLLLLATVDDTLHAFDAAQTRRWQTRLEHGPLAGAPTALGDRLLLATTAGIVYQLDAESGRALGEPLFVGQPLASAVVPLRGRWLVAAEDGCLLGISPP